MVVLTSTLYCTAGCKKGTTPIKPREEKHHAKVTPFGSSCFISDLETPCYFLSEKASPASLYPSGTA